MSKLYYRKLFVYICNSTATQTVQLWRYKDPLGDLKIPVFKSPTSDKVLIPSHWSFEVDIDRKVVNVSNGKEKHNIGSAITYIVEN